MKIDMHVHLADVDALVAAETAGHSTRTKGYLSRVLRWAAAERPDSGESGNVNEQWTQCLCNWVTESQLDRIVLLALDAVYDENGNRCHDRTMLCVDNDFVCSVAEESPGFMFGASIHPYRKDAVKELERVVDKGACLVKWLPSGQHIRPDSAKCEPFYEALAHYDIPLLSHTGVEHTLGSRHSFWNHPKRLVPALERGVKVIAAHCGVHLFLHEPSFFRSWASLARKYENMYGDTGAFSIVTRIPCLRRILKSSDLQRKLLYGSDFPGIPAPSWCWQLGITKMRALSRIRNPLERNMRVMQELDMPGSVFERAYELLRNGKEMSSNEC